jgi:beta-glucosidase
MLATYAQHFGFDRTFSTGETSRPDFLGLNYYSRAVVADDPDDPTPMKIKNVRPEAEYTAMDWEVAPDSLRQQLVRLGVDYQPGEIYITENGAAFEDTVTPEGEVKDDRRVAFYQSYLAAAHQAIQEGAPLKGYFAWSLMDNFEWAEGYEKRFGITYVDFSTQRRILKDSGKWYSQTIHQNGFTI